MNFFEKRKIHVGILLFIGLRGIFDSRANVIELKANLERFEALVDLSQKEDTYYTQIVNSFRREQNRGANSRLKVPQVFELENPNLRLEWQIRFPNSFPALKIDDLKDVTQFHLIDMGLWKILESQLPAIFQNPGRIATLKAEIRRFIESKAGFKEQLDSSSMNYSYWWKWVFDEARNEAELEARSQREDLSLFYAVTLFEEGHSKQKEGRVRNWLEARLHLYSREAHHQYLEAYDRYCLETLNQDYRTSPKDLLREIEISIGSQLRDLGVLVYVQQKIDWLNSLELDWVQQKRFALAALASQAQIQLLISSNQVVEHKDYMQNAELWEISGDFQKALLSYSRALELSKNSWERGLAYKGLGSSSLSRSRVVAKKDALQYQEWAIEYLRRALGDLASSTERDVMLNLYAEALGQMGHVEAVADVYESIFRGGSSRESQIAGLLKLLSTLDRMVVEKSTTPEATVKKADKKMEKTIEDKSVEKVRIANALRYASLLAAFARAHPKRSDISTLFLNSLNHRKVLNLDSNPVFQATLFEIENVISQGQATQKPLFDSNASHPKLKKSRKSGI